MNIQPVDPRDTQWQIDDPAYRVTFWSEREDTSGTPAWSASEFEVTGNGLEAEDVMSWAREQSKGNTQVVVYVLVDRLDSRPGLIRLAGHEPDFDGDTLRMQATQNPSQGRIKE
jgi:hypothetical protein